MLGKFSDMTLDEIVQTAQSATDNNKQITIKVDEPSVLILLALLETYILVPQIPDGTREQLETLRQKLSRVHDLFKNGEKNEG